ncbi:efflux RND transporter periplasmic adaptor subunit [Flavimarina sp. Hel_I_48]|uniref:efflux RND transporter periplasmic adaptor subunit n=1 Tax=Flavimarina sp. Hel_I_48 TaxID=1392488 RepID=UPI0004DF9838|nr:efflux RND transporter periplasmic adaptor subunit [Flavimarina sp. Hel_I_48]
MKKYLIYGILLFVGIGLGALLFSSSKENVHIQESTHQHIQESNNQELWTCSMHPQILKTEPGDCPICGMELIPATASDEGLGLNEIRMTKNAMALANVQTTVIGDSGQKAGTSITLSGKIIQNAEKMAVQASYFDGRIEKLNVNFEGQEIQKGQLLATIYSPDLVAAQQELLTAVSMKESQPQLYSAVRKKLNLWKLSENQINSIEKSGKVQENVPVYATVSGTVDEVMSAVGDYVKRGQPLLKVSNLSSVWAAFDVYENQLGQLKNGDSISIIANAFPDKKFSAQLSFIQPTLNTQSRTVSVRATLNNTENLLKPGMFVTGKLDTGTANKTAANSNLIIPASAVLWTGERSLVYVKTDKNEPVFEMREVTLGSKNGEMYSVSSGLENGEEIVTNGTFTVDAAAQLQDKKSMMNQAENTPTDEMMRMELPERFQREFIAVLPDYLRLKDDFFDGESTQISASAEKLASAFGKIDITELSGMVKSHSDVILKNLQKIEKTKDLEAQREAFVKLNENMVAIARNLNEVPQALYLQQCPMANNNKGALWLSASKEIRNPYYGEAMKNCGSVIDSLF